MEFPLRTGRGKNDRKHWRSVWRANTKEKDALDIYIKVAKLQKPELPCVCLLTRIAPSAGLDDDNLSSALKQIRDVMAHWLGVDDKHKHIVRYRYAQERGKAWAVRIEFLPYTKES